MKWLLIALLFVVPQVEEKEEEKPEQEEEYDDPTKEGHGHGKDGYKRNSPPAHGDNPIDADGH